MSISIILNQMIQLLLIMLLGFILAKTQLMTEGFNKKFTKITLNVSLPALILSSVLKQTGERNIKEVLIVFGIAIALYAVLPVISWLFVKLLRIPKEKQGLYMFMGVYGNVGFMGFPIIAAMYGDTAVFYTAIINLIFNLSVFSFGVPIMNYNTGKKSGFSLKNLKTPGIISAMVAILVYFLNIPCPSVIAETTAVVGNLTTPSAMLLIGSTLARIDLKSLFNEFILYPYSLIKQILIPVLFWLVLRIFVKDEFIVGIVVILAAMPVANTAVLFATEYGHDNVLAAKGVFLTTIMSIITVPLIVYICF